MFENESERKIIEAAGVKLLEFDESDPNGGFSGYGSIFNNWDNTWPVKEMVMPGAFKEALPGFLTHGFIALGHNWGDLPIAMVKAAQEDGVGLHLNGTFHSTAKAQEARTVMKERMDAGQSVRLSIGYKVLEDEWIEEGRLLKKLDLYEVSFVTVPANPLAAVTGVKSEENSLAGFERFTEQLERVLATVAGVSDRAKAIHKVRMAEKAGRSLSAANRTKLTDLHGSLQEVVTLLGSFLEDTDPEKDSQKAQEMKALRAQSLRLQSRVLANLANY